MSLTCPRCNATLAADAFGGLCPACLFGAALAPPADQPADSGQTPEAADSLVGDSLRYLGDYLLEDEIARGGMGVIYRARQRSLNRRVAVKMLLGGAQAGIQFYARFRREATAVARLRHPNIVSIFEIGEHEGRPYFSMELVEGGSLASLLRADPLPPRQAAELLVPIADAVHHAHEQGILHRDLKPSNILLEMDGSPRVTDFGLASDTAAEASLTASGEVMGTPAYMAPEQATGKRHLMTTATDVYGLGALLYHALTGRPPFQAAQIAEVMRQVIENEPVSPRQLNTAVPADLDTICLKCLEKDPLRRYISALELKEDVERFLQGEPISAKPITAPERAWKWAKRRPAQAVLAGAVVVLTLAILIGGPIALIRINQSRTQSEKNAAYAIGEAARAEQETSRANRALSHSQFRIADSLLASEREDSAKALAWLAKAIRTDSANSVAATRLVSLLSQRDWPLRRLVEVPLDAVAAPIEQDKNQTSAEVGGVAFSPDGTLMETHSGNVAWIFDAATGRLIHTLRHTSAVRTPLFSPDGTILATTSGNELRLWNAHTGEMIGPARVHEVPAAGALQIRDKYGILGTLDKIARDVVFSPDGKWVVTTGADGYGRVWDLAEGAAQKPVALLRDAAWRAWFSPDGKRLFTHGAVGYLYDSDTWKLVGTSLKSPAPIRFAAFSPDGRHLLTVGWGNTNAASIWDARTGQLAYPHLPLRTLTKCVYNPDGRLFAVAGMEGAVIYESAANPRPLFRFLQDAEVNGLAFSPDGQMLAVSCDDKNIRVYSTQTGQEITRPLRHSSKVPNYPAACVWSPFGGKLATIARDRFLHQWDVRPGAEIVLPLIHAGPINQGCFDSQGNAIATASDDQTAAIWDARSARRLMTLRGHTASVKRVGFSMADEKVITVGAEKRANVWNRQSGKTEVEIRDAKESGFNSAVLSPNGDSLIVGYADKLKVWNVFDEKLREAHRAGSVQDVRFSADQKWLLTSGPRFIAWRDAASFTNRIITAKWAMKVGSTFVAWRDNAPQAKLETPVELWKSDQPSVAAFSPDSKLVAMGGPSHRVFVCDTDSGTILLGPLETEGEVRHVTFSTDGKWIAAASDDNTARIWNSKTGKPRTQPLQHESRVRMVEFHPQNWLVAACSADGKLKLWSPETGDQIGEARQTKGDLSWLQFSPKGHCIVAGGSGNTAYIYPLPPRIISAPAWLAALAETVACLRINDGGVAEPVTRSATEIESLLTSLPVQEQFTELVRWAKWFLADRHERTLSWASQVTGREHLRHLVFEMSSEESIVEAARLYPHHPVVLASKASSQPDTAQSQIWSALARKTAPNDQDVKLLLEQKHPLPRYTNAPRAEVPHTSASPTALLNPMTPLRSPVSISSPYSINIDSKLPNARVLFSYRDPKMRFHDLWLINADGSEMTNLTQTPSANESGTRVSPDGTKIVFTVTRTGKPVSDGIYIMNLDGTVRRQLVRASDYNTNSLAGLLWTGSNTIGFNGRRTGDMGQTHDFFHFDVSSMIATKQFNVAESLRTGEGTVEDATGDFLSYLAIGSRKSWSPTSDILSIRSSGANPRYVHDDVLDDNYLDAAPRWSPAGDWVGWSRNLTGGGNQSTSYVGVAVSRADGADFRVLTGHNEFCLFQGWSPDGLLILFAKLDHWSYANEYGFSEPRGDLWLLHPATGARTKIISLPGTLPSGYRSIGTFIPPRRAAKPASPP